MNDTLIRFEHDHTTLSWGKAPEVVLPVGAGDLAVELFHHAPPVSGEIERAIDAIEDALGATGLQQDVRGDLHIDSAPLSDLLGLHLNGERCTRDVVEARFQHLASLSLGYPVTREDSISAPVLAAMLVILRECMHHLGFEAVMRAA